MSKPISVRDRCLYCTHFLGHRKCLKMNEKVPFSTRMEAVKRVQSGESVKSVSRVMKLDATEIEVWRYLLEEEGPNAVRLHPRIRANYALRCEIICEYEKKVVPLHVLSARYHVSHYDILRWISLLRHQVRVTSKEAIVELDLSDNHMESLIENADLRRKVKQQAEEISYLRAKVALLKKVQTLMAQHPHLRKGGCKPSSH